MQLFPQHALDTPEGVTYVPFIDGERVGYEIRRTDRVEKAYLYFNPSSDADGGTPNVFVYMGDAQDPAFDMPLHFYDIPHGLHGTVDNENGGRADERLSP